MKCNRCGLEVPYPKIRNNESEYSQCYYCDMHDTIESDRFDFDKYLRKLRRTKNKYHCVIGISGGMDSSILVYMSIRYLRINPLVVHFDNGYNTEVAKHNMSMLKKQLNFDMIVYSMSQKAYDDVNRSFILAGVPDADIANDMAMSYYINFTAEKYGIKSIFNGHNYRTEGTSPVNWSYMDAKYIKSVSGSVNFPYLTMKDQIRQSIKGIKQIRPFYYQSEEWLERIKYRLIKAGLKTYPCKHGENHYTLFVGAYYLPARFGIDKRLTYRAARKRSGIEVEKDKKVAIDFDKLPFSRSYINGLRKKEIDRSSYSRYNFKKYRLLFWVLMKLNYFSRTFYEKYCK